MKRFIVILVLMLSAIAADAQRISPVVNIDRIIYDETFNLLVRMERSSYIEKMEGIELDANLLTTSGGEILLRKDGNSINVIHVEFTKLLDDHIMNPKRSWYNIDSIRTELIIQNAKLFEYMYEVLSGNRNIKSIHIKIDSRTGGAYIRVDYYNL